MRATRIDGDDDREQSARPRWRAFAPTVVILGIVIALFIAICAQLPDMVYVPEAKDLEGHEFIIAGSEVHGIYGNKDVPSQVFSYRTRVRTDAELILLLEESILPHGWTRAADTDGAHCYRLAGSETRLRLDSATGTVFVGQLSDVTPSRSAWADNELWPRLR